MYQFSRRARKNTLAITGLSVSRQCLVKLYRRLSLKLHLEAHLGDNAVIGPSQHGFTRGRSCLTNLISFYDKITHLVDQGKPADVIFLDFIKAFDTVSHRILLDKMSIVQLNKKII